MANCQGIFQGQEISCDTPLGVGVQQRVLIANKEDVASVTFSITPGEENVIDLITMEASKSFFEFEGVNESISTQVDLIRQAVSNGYDHSLLFSVLEADNASLLNLQGMAYKKQVAIVYGAGSDASYGNGKISFFGWDAGLDLLTNTRIQADSATGGGFSLNLKTSDTGGKETSIPYPIFDALGYPATEAMIDALLIPVP